MKKIFVSMLLLFFGIIGKAYSFDMSISRTYTDDEGNSYTGRLYFFSSFAAADFSARGHNDFSYVEVDDEGNVIREAPYSSTKDYGRPAYVVNTRGQIIAKKPNLSSDIAETYLYTDDGKVLRYNTSGQLLGAYEDILDLHMATQMGSDSYNPTYTGVSNYTGNLSLVDANGDFSDYDSSGKIKGVYHQNGSVDTYKYDAGGNLIATYKDGKQTYAKESYTAAEAAAATKEKGNTVSITW